MSTVINYTVKCAVCEKESKQARIMSYSTFGYPDLDFRPASMLRETMEYWLHECPYCGYINTNLDNPCDLSLEAISDIYEEVESGFDWGQLPDRDYYAIRCAKLSMLNGSTGHDKAAEERFLNRTLRLHDDALQFAKLGAALAKLNDYSGAAKQFLRVAWIFDDNRDEQAATHWRKAAIEQVKIMMNRQQTQVTEETICIYADMSRRVGDFLPVFRLFEQFQPIEIDISDDNFIEKYGHLTMNEFTNMLENRKELSEQGYRLIKFQKELAEREDRAAHTIDEASKTATENHQPGMFFSL